MTASVRRDMTDPFLYLLCVLVVSAFLAGTGWLLASDLFAFSRDIPSTQRIFVEVTAEDDMGSIAQKLKDAGLIESKWVFAVQKIFYGSRLLPGTYTLDSNMTGKDILDIFSGAAMDAEDGT